MPKNNKGLKLGSEPRFISPGCGLRTQHRIISTVSVQTAAIIIALIYISGLIIIPLLSKKKILRIPFFNLLFSIIFTAILSTRKYKLYLLKVCPTWSSLSAQYKRWRRPQFLTLCSTNSLTCQKNITCQICLLKSPTCAFTFKNFLRHYAEPEGVFKHGVMECPP